MFLAHSLEHFFLVGRQCFGVEIKTIFLSTRYVYDVQGIIESSPEGFRDIFQNHFSFCCIVLI